MCVRGAQRFMRKCLKGSSSRPIELFLTFLAAAVSLRAQQPLGLVFTSQGATIQRPGREVPLAAVEGSALFEGDVLHAGSGSLRFSLCTTKTVQTLRDGSLVLDSSASLAQLAEQQHLNFCALPALVGLPSLPVSPRRAARLEGSFDSRVQRLPAAQQPALRMQLSGLDGAIRDRSLDPYNNDLQLAASRAVLLEQYGLTEDAIAAYDAIHDRWPKVEWAVHASNRLVQEAGRQAADQSLAARSVEFTPAAPPSKPPPIRKTYAILVGISQYRTESGIPWLSYADRDAETFAQHLEQPRGGSLRRCTDNNPTDCEFKILTNRSATLANITDAFHSFVLDHAAPENALVVFIAAHGVDPAMEAGWKSEAVLHKEPMILAYDSDYSETKMTGYAMSQLREEIAEQGLRYGRVIVFLDVCRAGNIGSIAGTSELQPAVRDVFTFRKGQVGLFMASQAQDDAYESSQFGDGHGAFTYSVLHSLNPLPPVSRKSLDFDNLLTEVKQEVRNLTDDQQVPDGRAVDFRMIVEEDPSLPGITLDPAYPIGDKKQLRRPRGARPSALKIPREAAPTSASDDFLRALEAGHLRRDEGSANARQALDRVEQLPDAALARSYRERLRVALEDRGEQVVLLYLRGDQENAARDQFEGCAKDFQEALRLEPRMAFDESRMLFCQGRALLYPDRANQKDYANAVTLLEQAIRLDSTRAYSYNALGIAYLERVPLNPAFYDLATAAFHDAIERAPYWAYPWHNLALAQTERGNYADAASDYRHGMALAPQFSYLPYNLGLLYQRIHRIDDAQTYYKHAIDVARQAYKDGIIVPPAGRKPEEAEANNALGTLAGESGNRSKARHYYREAIKLDRDSLSARYNLALLVSAKRGGSSEAENLWAENLEVDQNHLPTLIAQASYFSRQHRWNSAIADWGAVLGLAPDHLTAKLQLAAAYVAAGQPARAVPWLQAAEKQAPTGAAAWEQIGHLYDSAAEFGLAARAYEKALAAARVTGDRSLVQSLERRLAAASAKGVAQ
jgi:tetratricopeptide (TPR) repeat protein